MAPGAADTGHAILSELRVSANAGGNRRIDHFVLTVTCDAHALSSPAEAQAQLGGLAARIVLVLGFVGTVMNDVTQILSRIESGDPTASEQLLPLVYDELRLLAAQRLSQEKPGQTLQATALVHEAYLRLVDGKECQGWNGRAHFFGAAAEAMRRILVERARQMLRPKRGGRP